MEPAPGKTLILVRHAKSSWDLDVDDAERPLSGRGRRDARAIGELLVSRAVQPDLVLCSPATRTCQTWEGAVAAGANAGDVRIEPAIYRAWVPELVSLIRAVSESVDTLLMVGHAPGIPDLVEHLAAREGGSDLWARMEAKFPTAAVAILDVPGAWSDVGKGRAHLDSFQVARANT